MNYLAAAIQMRSGSDKAANLATAERLVRLAATRGAQLAALPEAFNWRGSHPEEGSNAERLDGETLARMARLARELGIHLLAGSITERSEDDSRNYNTSVMLGPDGQRLAVYRKIHLFDVDLAGGPTVRESERKLAGTEIAVARTALGLVGLSICYDLRFPELYRSLASRGATVVTVPSAFTFTTGEAHWEVLLRARAIENQCYVLAPAQYGRNVHGYADYGNSLIVDPWGRVVARASEGEDAVIAGIDQDYVSQVRRELPALDHRRLAAGDRT